MNIGLLNSKSVLEQGHVGLNHYIKYADGRLEQWGIVSVNYETGYGTIKYPKPFVGTKNDYVIFVQQKYIPGIIIENAVVDKNNSVTQATVYTRDNKGNKVDTHDIDWFARGKWK